MRRRRGNRGTWLPVNPTFIDGSDLGRTYYDYVDIFPEAVTEGDMVQRATTLTLDDTPDVNTTGEYTLRDYTEGQDYVLERVVGKIACFMDQGADFSVRRAIVCAAVAILPTQSGASTPDLPPEEWNPLLAQNAQQPWAWRRTWLLGNDPGSPESTRYTYPIGNCVYGSGGTYDGPHIDTKGVKRRVTKEQRVYLITAGAVLQVTDATSPGDTRVHWNYDLRLFGAMRRGKNKSAF